MTTNTKQTILFPELAIVICPCCGSPMRKIGVTDVIEGHGIVEVDYYQCPQCRALGIDEDY